MNKYQQQWENLGQSDPYWAVLTEPDKKNGNWDKNAFFDTGKKEIATVLARLGAKQCEPKRGVAVDFGCGAGRLSQALSFEFERVIAVDISQSMLDCASENSAEIKNIEFTHNTRNDLSFIPSSSVDFVYSNIVLQHMPASSQVKFVREFCRILAPGGIMVIQTPVKYNLGNWQGWMLKLLGNRLMNLLRRMKYGKQGVMELHISRHQSIVDIFAEGAIDILEISSSDAAGNAFHSNTYFARKSGKSG